MARPPHEFLPLKPDTFEILLALEAAPQHGYAILKAVEARGIAIAASLLYRKLKRLMEEGLVEEVRTRARDPEDDARRRYYRLTPLGLAVVGAEARRIMELAKNREVRKLAARAKAEGGGA